MSRLTRELNYCVLFYTKFCIFWDISSGKVRGIGKLENNLYIVSVDCALEPQGAKLSVNSAIDSTNVVSANSAESLSLWHRILRHPPPHVTLKKLNCLKNVVDKSLECCTVCPLAKQSKKPFP